jgi:hypothetical protein
MAKTQRIFELQPCCQSSSGVGSSVFCPFSAKKGERFQGSAWCWRCQSKYLIVGEKNGVFLGYF